MTPEEKIEALKELKKECFSCKACGLYKNVINGITPYCFGRGNVNARIVFCAEAPGEKETRQKRPLVGPAGRNFSKIISYLGLRREEIYISNTVKCRPVDGYRNRAPTDDEKTACRIFLVKEIQIIQPQLVVTLGAHALRFFVDKRSIMLCHGNLEVSQEFNASLYPLLHPSPYNTNNPARKKIIQSDVKKLKNIIDKMELKIEKTHDHDRSGACAVCVRM